VVDLFDELEKVLRTDESSEDRKDAVTGKVESAKGTSPVLRLIRSCPPLPGLNTVGEEIYEQESLSGD